MEGASLTSFDGLNNLKSFKIWWAEIHALGGTSLPVSLAERFRLCPRFEISF